MTKKHNLYFLLFIFLFQILHIGLYAQTNADELKWKADLKLKWTDFKALPDKSSPHAATTFSKLNYSYTSDENGKQTIKVNCCFIKSKSWKKKEVVNAYILTHEQLHFDITELYARKTRQAMAKYLKENANSENAIAEIKQIFSTLFAEKVNFDTQYDLETNHSRNKEKQEEWQIKVKDMMKELAEYASK